MTALRRGRAVPLHASLRRPTGRSVQRHFVSQFESRVFKEKALAVIADRVASARGGTNPHVITRLRSGWVVIGDVQFLPGYCLLLADPVVPSLNDLSAAARAQFLLDMARVGDAILTATDCFRINYEILGNSEPELHAHVFPRYLSEPQEKRTRPVWFYDWASAPRFSTQEHGHIVDAIRLRLPARA